MTRTRVNYNVTINGRTFKARHGDYITVQTIYGATNWNAPVTLNEVYSRCSDTKHYAYNYWRLWVGKYFANGTSLRIGSHTAQFFTLIMVVKDVKTGEWWRCTATGRNEYATRIAIE